MPTSGPLKRAITDWFGEIFDPADQSHWWGRVAHRAADYTNLLLQLWEKHRFLAIVLGAVYLAKGWIYALTGIEYFKVELGIVVADESLYDPSQAIADAIRKAIQNPTIRELAESYGAIYTEPFIAFFDEYAGREDIDPAEFIRALHGFPLTANMVSGVAAAIYEAAGLGQLDALSSLNDTIQKSLGIEYVFYETIRPMIESGMSTSIGRYFDRKYRPKRFAAGDLRDLYALGELTPETLRDEARALGWREQDIDRWIRLAFRTISQGDVFDALHQGYITQDQAIKRLRALGYDPADIPLLFQLNPPKNEADAKQLSASDSRSAFREGVIGEDRLRALLAALKYDPTEIDIIVATEKAKIEQQRKGLTISQVKAGWQENVLTDQEADHWLSEAGIAPEQIQILLATWRSETAPAFRQLNAGTITAAYVEGVIARAAARDRLVSVGLSEDDAELTLRLAEARNPEAFGQISPASSRRVTPAQLADLVALELLTPAQMAARLVEVGYTEADAALLAEAARLRSQPAERVLSQSTIERAYVAGVVDRAGALDLLTGAGFMIDQANLVLDSVEQQNPETFGLPVPERIRQLSPAALEDLYLSGLQTEAEYRARLAGLGFLPGDVDLQIARSNLLLTPPPRQLTQSSIERAYLAGVFDRDTAYSKLVVADFTPADANTILDTIEAANPAAFSPGLVQSSRVPSISTLAGALQNKVIDLDTFLARAQEIGYSSADAQLYATLSQNTERKAAKTLSVSQILAAYEKGIMPRGTALDRIMAQGYANDDALLLLRIQKESIVSTDTWDSLLSGAITAFDAMAALVNDRYSDQDIIDAFGSVSPDLLAVWGVQVEQIRAALAAIPGGA